MRAGAAQRRLKAFVRVCRMRRERMIRNVGHGVGTEKSKSRQRRLPVAGVHKIAYDSPPQIGDVHSPTGRFTAQFGAWRTCLPQPPS